MRGFGNERPTPNFADDHFYQFPSPCGVLGMKVSQLEQLQLDAEYRAFPSPCGVLGMKAAEIQAINSIVKENIIQIRSCR